MKLFVSALLAALLLCSCSASTQPEAAPSQTSAPVQTLAPVQTDAPAETAIPVAGADLNVLYMNVGKADAALVWTAEKTFLIDTGTKDSAEHMLEMLGKYGVQRLDGVILTHSHSDHTGGLKKLAKAYAVDMLYGSKLSVPNDAGENKIQKLADKYALPLTLLSAGDSVEIGNGLRFEVLGPVSYSEEENDNSLVLRLEVNGKTLLFTGDMQFEEEASLLTAGVDVRSDVLKVGNHGNPDATSEEFAAACAPKYAVISTDTSVDTDSANVRVLSALETAQIFITQDFSDGVLLRLSGDTLELNGV